MRIASDEDRLPSGRGRARHRVACPTNHKPHLFQIPAPARALAADHPDPTPVPEFTRSDALDLNEKYCVRLLVRAVRGGARPDDCARSAAGIHLRDRTCRAEALLRILRQRSSPEAFAVDDEGNVAGHPALAQEIDEYARDLLAGESASGGATLVGSLVDILRKPAPGSYPTPGASPPASARNPNPAVPGSIPPGAGTAPSFIQTPGGTATTPGGGAFAGFGASSQPGLFGATAAAQPGSQPANPLSLAPTQQQPFGAPGIFGAQPTSQPGGGVVQAQQPGQPGGAVVAHTAVNNDPFAATARLELVEDERGRLCRRAEWLSNERRVVAECLYHAIVATGVRSGDVNQTDTPGGALSATDAKAVMELFAEVATPTVARACADARARSLDAGRAQAAAAQVAAVGALDEYSGVPGSSPAPIGDLPQSVQEDLPAAIVVALAAVAAVTPNGGSNGGSTNGNGAKSYAQVVEAASAALQKAVDDANERAGVAAPVKIDPLRALGDYPFLNARANGTNAASGSTGSSLGLAAAAAGGAARLRSRRGVRVRISVRDKPGPGGTTGPGNDGKTTPIFRRGTDKIGRGRPAAGRTSPRMRKRRSAWRR